MLYAAEFLIYKVRQFVSLSACHFDMPPILFVVGSYHYPGLKKRSSVWPCDLVTLHALSHFATLLLLSEVLVYHSRDGSSRVDE